MKKNILIAISIFVGINIIFRVWYFLKHTVSSMRWYSDEIDGLFVQWLYQEYVDVATQRRNKKPLYYYPIAVASVKIGDFTTAEQYFLRAYRFDGNPIAQKFLRSLTLINKGDYVWAKLVLENIEVHHIQEKSVLHILRGVIAYETKNIKDALSHLVSAEKTDPLAPITLRYLALVYLQQKRRNKAQEYLQRIVWETVTMKSIDMWSKLASTLFRTKKYEQALSYYDQIYVLDPDFGDTQHWFTYSRILMDVEQFTKALRTIDYALEQSPQDVQLIRHKAKIYQSMNDTAQALQVYNDMLAYTDITWTIEIWIEQVQLYNDLTMLTKRDELIEKISLNIPESPALYALFVRKLMTLGQFDIATVYIEKALWFKPDNKNLLSLQKELLLKQLYTWLAQRNPMEDIRLVLRDRYSTDTHVVYALALWDIHLYQDYALALRGAQIVEPDITQQDLETMYAWYLVETNQQNDAWEQVQTISAYDQQQISYFWLQWRYHMMLSSDTSLQERYQDIVIEKVAWARSDNLTELYKKHFSDFSSYIEPYISWE